MNKDDILNIIDNIKINFPAESENLSSAISLLINEIQNIHTLANKTLQTKVSKMDYDNVFMDFVKQINELVKELQVFTYEPFIPDETIEYTKNEFKNKNIQKVNYNDYKVNNSIPHYVTESFTNKRPSAYQLEGFELHEAENWIDIYYLFLEQIISLYPSQFSNLLTIVTGRHPYLSYNASDIRKPKKLSNNIYYETNLSAIKIIDNISKILDYFSIPVKKFKIYLRADYTDLHR